MTTVVRPSDFERSYSFSTASDGLVGCKNLYKSRADCIVFVLYYRLDTFVSYDDFPLTQSV